MTNTGTVGLTHTRQRLKAAIPRTTRAIPTTYASKSLINMITFIYQYINSSTFDLYRTGQRVLIDLQRTSISRCCMIQLLAHPLPSSPVSKLYLIIILPMCRLSSLLTRGGGRCGGGAKSDDGEKAWSSINHSIHSWIGLVSIDVLHKIYLEYHRVCPLV
jgi:hypothetical protein